MLAVESLLQYINLHSLNQLSELRSKRLNSKDTLVPELSKDLLRLPPPCRAVEFVLSWSPTKRSDVMILRAVHSILALRNLTQPTKSFKILFCSENQCKSKMFFQKTILFGKSMQILGWIILGKIDLFPITLDPTTTCKLTVNVSSAGVLAQSHFVIWKHISSPTPLRKKSKDRILEPNLGNRTVLS